MYISLSPDLVSNSQINLFVFRHLVIFMSIHKVSKVFLHINLEQRNKCRFQHMEICRILESNAEVEFTNQFCFLVNPITEILQIFCSNLHRKYSGNKNL